MYSKALDFFIFGIESRVILEQSSVHVTGNTIAVVVCAMTHTVRFHDGIIRILL